MVTINQKVKKTPKGQKISTEVRVGPHVVEVVEYTSNKGYYVIVNGAEVRL